VWVAAKVGLCRPQPCQPRNGPWAAGASEGLILHPGTFLRLAWGTGAPSLPGKSPSSLLPNRKGLAEHLPGTGVVLCHGPEFCFPVMGIKYDLFDLQLWGSSTCWEERSQLLNGCELGSFLELQYDFWWVCHIYTGAWSE